MIAEREALKHKRPTYATVNLDNLAHNINFARSISGGPIMAVVKADAYGHGAERVALHAYEVCKVKDFCVATIAEGISLREVLKDTGARILVLGYVDELFYEDLFDNALVPVVFDMQYAQSLHRRLSAHSLSAHVALKIDTGMGRLGFPTSFDLYEFIQKFPRFQINHVMSHISSADDVEYTSYQAACFSGWLDKHSDVKGFDSSLCSSYALLNSDNIYSFGRPGIMLYGYGSAELKPVMSVHSKLVHVLPLKKGQAVSYGRRFVADRDMWAGVVPVGYADGYSRGLSCRSRMYIDNVYCPVLGAVCMDMTMVDVSHFGESACGRAVEVMGSHVSATELANLLNTIEYEVLCGISGRVPRIYEGGF